MDHWELINMAGNVLIVMIILLAVGGVLLLFRPLISPKRTALARYLKNGNEQEGTSRNFLTMPNPQTQNVGRNPVGTPVRSSSVNDYIGYFVLLDHNDQVIRLRAKKNPERNEFDLENEKVYTITYRAGRLLSAVPKKAHQSDDGSVLTM